VTPAPAHPDPYRQLDAQPDPGPLIASLEERGRTRPQTRLRRRFLRFAGIRRGHAVLEVGCGTGVVLRDVAALVGPRGRVVGVDPSRAVLRAARRFCAGGADRAPIALRLAAGEQLPFRAAQFDAAVAVTVLLHVADPLRVVKEMVRITRPGGRVAVQDQDFGTVAVAHPDRDLTDRVLRGVAFRIYEEPYSGRRLPALLRTAGLTRVRLRTDVYQDTAMEPYTQTFLERRAERAVRFGLVDPATAQRWLDGFTALVRDGGFVMTVNYYGAVGQVPASAPAAPPRPGARRR
jgi:ubiquinone/menaquinone biosynthesis C-methylase UbiE